MCTQRRRFKMKASGCVGSRRSGHIVVLLPLVVSPLAMWCGTPLLLQRPTRRQPSGQGRVPHRAAVPQIQKVIRKRSACAARRPSWRKAVDPGQLVPAGRHGTRHLRRRAGLRGCVRCPTARARGGLRTRRSGVLHRGLRFESGHRIVSAPSASRLHREAVPGLPPIGENGAAFWCASTAVAERPMPRDARGTDGRFAV